MLLLVSGSCHPPIMHTTFKTKDLNNKKKKKLYTCASACPNMGGKGRLQVFSLSTFWVPGIKLGCPHGPKFLSCRAGPSAPDLRNLNSVKSVSAGAVLPSPPPAATVNAVSSSRRRDPLCFLVALGHPVKGLSDPPGGFEGQVEKHCSASCSTSTLF